MRSMQLLDELQFGDSDPVAEPLLVDKDGRILRFCLRPHQRITQHNVPNSPLYAIVLKGQGVFADHAGVEVPVGPNTLVVFEPGEEHALWALDEELVLVGFLQSVPGTRHERDGGSMGSRQGVEAPND